jgi:cytochrome bd ubiquinol oxidase subunit I
LVIWVSGVFFSARRVPVSDALLLHRLQFGFTITYHYLFPQLTMGLGLLIVILKTIALRTGDPVYNDSARFWGRIFGINFVMGVVTGIPMEFQFGTNWAHFSRTTGGVIGQPLAMEGVFSFFLESAFLGLFLYGERRLSAFGHWCAAFLVFLGSWLSGFFIIVTDAWMQHPVAYRVLPSGLYEVTSFWKLLFNPWGLLQYAHNMSGAVTTGAFVMCAVGAFYLLEDHFAEYGKVFLKIGIVTGTLACVFQIFPSGDFHGRYLAKNQPATVAAMEGLFKSTKGAPIVLMGQPNVEKQTIDNPLVVNDVLSFLIYGTRRAEVTGLDKFPVDQWPTNIPLLFFSYHVMAGLGTYFAALMAVGLFLLWRKKLFTSSWILWLFMLSFPLPYIANTAGWMTAELGRQPWLVYGLIRTADGSSSLVSSGNVLFTLLGFMGMYVLLSILFILLVYREIHRGPQHTQAADVTTGSPITAA